MPKVICTLPNASEEISGVKFQPHPDREGVMVSETVDDNVAARFCSIPGYELLATKPAVDAEEKTRERDEKEALLKRAAELNVVVSNRWGLEKLRESVQAAEAAAAAAEAGKDKKTEGDASGGDQAGSETGNDQS